MSRSLRFRLVRAIGALIRPFVRRLDMRRHPLPGQVELRPRRTVQWDLSKLTWIGPEPFWWGQRTYTLDASFAIELRDAEVLGHGVVFTRAGEAVLESTIFQETYFRRSHVEHFWLFRRWMKADTFEAVIPLTNYLDMSYFHWTLESLGRLALVEDHLRDPAWKILISERGSMFLRTTTAFLFGISEDRIITGTSRRKRIHRCLIASNPHSRSLPEGGVEVYPPEHIRWLNQRGQDRVGGIRAERHNIIITRRKQPGRRLLNEEELLARFPQLNFRLVALEDLSIHEQVDTFAHAGVIVAVHGAGLANLVYATDAAIIEFYPTPLQPKNSAYFVQIAACLGLPHLVLHFEGKGPAPHWDHTLTVQDYAHMEAFLRRHGRIGQ